MDKISPIHPGQILKEEFLDPFHLSQNALAKAIHVPPRRINEIVHGKRAITPDTAIRLSVFFGTSPEFWLHLQAKYELETAKDKVYEKILKSIEPFAA